MFFELHKKMAINRVFKVIVVLSDFVFVHCHVDYVEWRSSSLKIVQLVLSFKLYENIIANYANLSI